MDKLTLTLALLLLMLHSSDLGAQAPAADIAPAADKAPAADTQPAADIAPAADTQPAVDTQPAETEPPSDQEAEMSAEQKAAEFDKRLDALLGEATAADAYGAPIHCLYRRKFRHIDIVSEDLLLFSNGSNYWVNTLKRRCVGLRSNMVIHTMIKGISSLCENDMVFANNSFDLSQGMLPGGRPVVVRAQCVLGEFKPIDEVYAESLKAMSRR